MANAPNMTLNARGSLPGLRVPIEVLSLRQSPLACMVVAQSEIHCCPSSSNPAKPDLTIKRAGWSGCAAREKERSHE